MLASLHAGVPDGPVLELASGRSGSALELASHGRRVVAVDVSDRAMSALAAEARRRGLGERIECVLADLASYAPGPGRFSLVLCTHFWDPSAYLTACAAVAPGGLIGWEALSSSREDDDRVCPWYLPHGELSARLPDDFDVLDEHPDTTERHRTTRLLARRRPPSDRP